MEGQTDPENRTGQQWPKADGGVSRTRARKLFCVLCLRIVLAQVCVEPMKRNFHTAKRRAGRIGGRNGTGKSKARTSAQARAAARARWGKKKS